MRRKADSYRLLDCHKKKAKRQEDERRQREQARDTQRRQEVRHDNERRQLEQNQDTLRRQEARQDDERRKLEQAQNTLRRQDIRQDDERRQLEQNQDTLRRQEARQDDERRQLEQNQDTLRRQEARQDDERRKLEQARNTLRRQEARKSNTGSYSNALAMFHARNRDGPTNVCLCCGGLFFDKSVQVKKKESLLNTGCTDEFLQQVVVLSPKEDGKYVLCSTCYENIKNSKVNFSLM